MNAILIKEIETKMEHLLSEEQLWQLHQVLENCLILPRYLQVYLSLPETQTVLYRDCVNGSTNQIELSKESFGKMLVPVVDISKQRAFIDFVYRSDKSKFYG